VYYKPESGVAASAQAFQFAFSMGFNNGIKGSQFVPFNTFQPSLNSAEAEYGVTNWVQINNMGTTAENGSLIFYDLSGAEMETLAVGIPGGARRDFSAHQFGPSLVGVIEWRPESSSVDFQVRNVRYYYDSADTSLNSFVTANQFEARVGSGSTLVAPLDSNGASAILEISNTLNSAITVDLNIYDTAGDVLQSSTLSLAAKATEHVIADGILNGGQGLATIKGSQKASVVATAMHYGRDEFAGIKYIYGIPAREATGSTITGTHNTYLAQGCTLYAGNISDSEVTVTVNMVRSDGTAVLSDHQEVIPAKGLLAYDLCGNEAADNYGVTTVQASGQNAIVASIVRIGENDQYRFETPVRQ
jgi:hypothetical protein